jgi:DNA ligase-associated metallophosphoesterase
MSALLPHQALVSDDVVLDGRLALFHRKERWLAIADPHFGYELSQRAAGRLVPMWGMAAVRERLLELVREYDPRTLIIVGDLVHDAASAREAAEFLTKLRTTCGVIVIAGNHDRDLRGAIDLVDSWQTSRFHFHHGHCAVGTAERMQVIGHHHPAATISDGAGLRLKCPAFVQQSKCWIMPAFSPWAAGSKWQRDPESRVWLCTPQRVLRLPELESVST